jgi:hypothetical protein
MLETCNSNLTSCFYGFAVPRLQQIHKSRQTAEESRTTVSYVIIKHFLRTVRLT